MQIVDFTAAHVMQAALIAKQNYEDERGFVPALPPVCDLPDLTAFAENGLGVAAFDGNDMIGFMCSISLFERPFQIENLVGAYVPLHAHGAVLQGREKIYAEMYRAAAGKWIKEGAKSHAITLYAHDMAAQTQFFQYRFGLNGIDAIREITDMNINDYPGFEFTEILPDEFELLWTLHNLMLDHFLQSPIFIRFPRGTKEEFRQINERQKPRYFAVKADNTIIAFMKLSKHGETFFSSNNDMMNVCGAYLLPEFRGKGIYGALLSHVLLTLKREGYKRLGVDFESFNFTARKFWLKHFTVYTNSVVRRID